MKILLFNSSTIREEIIPHAVSWFTGEVTNDDEDISLIDIEEDETDEDEDEEDEAAEN